MKPIEQMTIEELRAEVDAAYPDSYCDKDFPFWTVVNPISDEVQSSCPTKAYRSAVARLRARDAAVERLIELIEGCLDSISLDDEHEIKAAIDAVKKGKP